LTLLDAGIKEQNEIREYFILDENIEFYDEEKKVKMLALPSEEYQITSMIDFNSQVLGSQHASFEHISEFKTELADARTFCFLHELEILYENNLIKGGDLNNAIVVVDRKVKEEELLKAKIIASRPGHKTNIEFAQQIKAHIKAQKKKIEPPKYDPNQKPIYSAKDIIKVLPHASPMLLVDKIVELTDSTVVAIKSVTYNEPFFTGHFPGNPIMPGVLIIEAMAQAGGILALNTVEDPNEYETYFMKIEQARFKNMVVPGDTLILDLKLLRPIRRGICEMKGVAYVGSKIASEAVLMAQIAKKRP